MGKGFKEHNPRNLVEESPLPHCGNSEFRRMTLVVYIPSVIINVIRIIFYRKSRRHSVVAFCSSKRK